MKFCPRCSAPLKDESSKFCMKCGCPVQEDSTKGIESAASNGTMQNVCSKCGYPLREGAKFCLKCGKPCGLPKKTPIAQSHVNPLNLDEFNEPAKDKKSLWIFLTIPLVILVSVVVYNFGVVSKVKDFVISHFFSPVEDFYQSQFEYEKIVDARDNKKYHAIKIGEQFWIAQNMNYATDSSVCDSCELYGRLYTHEDALNACPEGFVLPTYLDFLELDGMLEDIKHWFSVKGVSGGLDSLGFAAIPSGFFSYKDSVVKRRGAMAGYWIADFDRDNALRIKVDDEKGKLNIEGLERSYGFAVRCIKKETSKQSEFAYLIDGRDSKYYKTIVVGGKRWMAQNLDYKTPKSWRCADEGSKCDWPIPPMLGRSYTWDEALVACPEGWHLPAKSEMDSLLIAVGGKNIAGRGLKGFMWANNGTGSNEYGFSALSGGQVVRNVFTALDSSAYLWTVSEFNASKAYAMHLSYRSDAANVESVPKKNGLSVRCVEGVPNSGIMIDLRDSKKYEFVKIGNQVWMAENLDYKTKLGEGTGRDVCYSNLHGQHAFLYEDALEACPNGWRLPTDDDWVELVDYAQNACGKDISVTECLAIGIWGFWESDDCCVTDGNGFCVEGENGDWIHDYECAQEKGLRLEAKNLLGFGAVGFLPDDFVLGSECRAECGGPVDSKYIANFWSASKKILTVDMTENLPALKLHEDPAAGSDDCSDGIGGYSTRTEFSLKNVGKTVASVRCVKAFP